MDAKPPLGDGRAQSPKQLLLAALCGGTAMDVVSLMRKHQQNLERFEVTAEAQVADGSLPAVFTGVSLEFHLQGKIDPAVATEAVRMSQTRYCGVSAMLSRAFPIHYQVFVNSVSVGGGDAYFG